MVRGIANSKIGFGDLILLLRYFFKLKVSTHPNVFKASVNKKIYNYMGLIGLILILIYLNDWTFLSQPESIAILPSVILTLLGLGYFSQHNLRLNPLKAVLIFSLFILAYTQHHDLNTLQNYYDSLHTGETWQQYGAL